MAAASKKRKRRNPATRLTDDLIVEILCVSKDWRGLISHPEHRNRLPQTLAGFFYTTTSCERFPESARHFTNVTGRGAPLIRPSLSFLPGYANIEILDSCNGLLLCCSLTAAGAVRYVVCNPATEELAALPESSQAGKICNARLGFDPAVSPHFHVFEFVETDDSECLEFKVKVFVLEDYASDNWVLKHSVKALKLVGTRGGLDPFHYPIAIHPESNLIFFISDLDHTIKCYDMDC
ncbi:hypothetical protein GQ55_9G429400 [Panicum hallii var. hallii]|uniref:F-box associated beta-propeller type 1 domain-containing protein n=1 Tax=Panicum hallii var. hallii TaxID=1504633 RepID=A0A2T7CAY7_9POAL|nr:hypothetical protein GQ55_9G429400 [Panicum hallii var. hallii]